VRCCFEIAPLSFHDSNGDGKVDRKGIESLIPIFKEPPTMIGVSAACRILISIWSSAKNSRIKEA
jgi:hypothetical protein